MTKTFCDRCGREIEKDDAGSVKSGFLTHRTLCAVVRLIPYKIGSEWMERKDMTICPACEDSFAQWFEKNEPIKEDENDDQPRGD